MARRELPRGWLGDDTVRDAWVLDDAVSIYLLDATLASAFVARWCAGYKIETAEDVFRGTDG